MNNKIFRKKLFIATLTFLAKRMLYTVKNASPKEKQKYETLLGNYEEVIKIIKRAIVSVQEELPPASPLDALFEEVIEKSKLAETYPTLTNSATYKATLEDFMSNYNSSSDHEKNYGKMLLRRVKSNMGSCWRNLKKQKW